MMALHMCVQAISIYREVVANNIIIRTNQRRSYHSQARSRAEREHPDAIQPY